MTTIISPDNVFEDLLGDIPPNGVLIHVPRDLVKTHVFDSPFQYRRTYNEAKLAELAQNIKETGGIHQPLLARPRMPNPLRPHFEPENGIELAAGHRRKIGGLRVDELETFPILVKKLTDDQVRSIQITENLQREDVHPIEEAEGFQALIEYDDKTADELAVQFGRSRSYVYGRLKLLAAIPEIRKACLEGEIVTEVALLIARLRTDDLQKKALAAIRNEWQLRDGLNDGGKRSFRAIRDLLNEKFSLDLREAIFDREDATLVPAAGDCGSCPKRSGNAPEYEDVASAPARSNLAYSHNGNHPRNAGADVCTDPDCFASKKAAHLRNQAKALADKGKTVVTGNAARAAISATGEVKGAYIALKDVKDAVKKGGKAGNVATVTIQDPRTGKTVQAVKKADLETAGVKVAAKSTPHRATQYDWAKEQKEREARALAENEKRQATLKRVHAAAAVQPRSHADMCLIVDYSLEMLDSDDVDDIAVLWGYEDRHALVAAMTNMSGADLALLLLDCAMTNQIKSYGHEHEDRPVFLDRAAALYPEEPVATPSTAARAAKGAKGKAEKKAKPPAPAGAGVDLAGDPIASNQSDDAGSAGEEAKNEPADAGVERDQNTSDMFQGEPA
jgi:ParB/RepB/Spo0J family partition protein